MNSTRLLELLAKGDVAALAPAEERELAQLLEDPASRAVLTKKLAATRQQVADLQGYQAALGATEPVLSAESLRRLIAENVAAVAKKDGPRRAPIIPFRKWLAPIGAAAAIAASVALVVWLRPSHPSLPGTIEYGLVANPTTMRATTEDSTSGLGAGWRVTTHQNLGALEAWAGADLPPGTSARLWVDQEAGVIRAVARRRDGQLDRWEQPLETRTPLPDQLRRLGERINQASSR